MGNKLPPLKRREIIEILLHNGFAALPRKSTSHMRYRGMIDGKVVLGDVDASHENSFRNRVLHFIGSSQANSGSLLPASMPAILIARDGPDYATNDLADPKNRS